MQQRLQTAILVVLSSLIFLNTISGQEQNKIAGLVLDTNNKPIKGIVVRLYRGSLMVGETTTLQDGVYSLSFRPGSTITTIEYYGSEWNPTTISNVSGAKDHTINKVLHRIGTISTKEQQVEFLGSLDQLYLIARENNVSFDQYKVRYGAAIDAARKGSLTAGFVDLLNQRPYLYSLSAYSRDVQDYPLTFVAELLPGSLSAIDFGQRSQNLELNFNTGVQEIVIDFARPFEVSTYTLSLDFERGDKPLLTEIIQHSKNDRVLRLHFLREQFRRGQGNYYLTFAAGQSVVKIPVVVTIER